VTLVIGPREDAPVRVLALCFNWPWPVRSGGQHRLTAMLKALSELGPLELCIVSPQPPDDEGRAATLEALHPVHALEIPLREHPKRRLNLTSWSNAPWWDPWGGFDFEAARRLIRAELRDPHFGVVWSYSAIPARLLAGWDAPVRVLDLPELPDVAQLRHGGLGSPRSGPIGYASGLKWKGITKVRAFALRRVHRRACAEASHVVVCSEADREAIRYASEVLVVPNGYDIPRIPVGRRTLDGQARTLMFPGMFLTPANKEGAVFFAREVMPRVRQRLPDAHIRIVGQPSPEVLALSGCDGVEIVGAVDSIEDELVKADAVVVPLRIGTGTRLKILEAWAHAIPVVSTTVGAEGLPVLDRTNLLLADSAAELADACVQVLTDKNLRVRLGDAGRRTAESGFSWTGIQADFATALRAALRGQTPISR